MANGKKHGKGKTTKPPPSAANVGQKLRSKLRVITHQWKTWREPLPADAITTPLPDGTPGYRVRDSQSYEALHADIAEFAGLVWQIKDGLIKWLETRPGLKLRHTDGTGKVIDGGGDRAEWTVEEIAKTSVPLLLCADLYNTHKHYDDCDRSKHKPFLCGTEFDTSQSGVIGLKYNGTTKTGDILNTTGKPVPVRVEVLSGNHPVNFGDSVTVIGQAFKHWIPLIRSMGLLSPNVPEDRAILDDLDLIEAQVTAASPHKPGEAVTRIDDLPPHQRKLARDNPAEFLRQRQTSGGDTQT